jgi:hypothetical protein
MYGDPDAIRRLATTMTEQGTTLRDEAGRLLARAETVPWEGLAAEAMRQRVREQVTGLHWAAVLADEAADALTRHAQAVEERGDLVGDLLGLVS